MVLDDDGQPRFVWDEVTVTGTDWATVVVASVMERRRWRQQYEHAEQATLDAEGPPVDNHSATITAATDAA